MTLSIELQIRDCSILQRMLSVGKRQLQIRSNLLIFVGEADSIPQEI